MAVEKIKSLFKGKSDNAKGGRAGSAGSAGQAKGVAGGGGAKGGKGPAAGASAGKESGAGKGGSKGAGKGGGKVAPISPSRARLERRANDEKIIRNIKIAFTTIVIIAVIGVLLSVFLYVYKPTVATVGGLGIEQYEFLYNLKSSSMYASEYSTSETLGQQAFKSAVDSKVLGAIAKERGFAATQEDRDTIDNQMKYIDQMAASSGGAGADLGADSYIRQNFGISASQYKKIMQGELIANHLMEDEYNQITVPDEDAQAKYNEKISTYKEATVRHILFKYEGENDDGSTRTPEESEMLAKQTVERINAGEDMGELVQELSEDSDLSNEGIYVLKPTDGYEQGFLDWTFDSARYINEVGICETSYGYHVMRLEGMRDIPFEEVSESIISEIKSAELDKIMEGWRNEQRFQPKINQPVYDSVVAQAFGS